MMEILPWLIITILLAIISNQFASRTVNAKTQNSSISIPLIDISVLFWSEYNVKDISSIPEEVSDVVLQIDSALRNYGIFIATGLGEESESLFSDAIKVSQDLFNLSLAQKETVKLNSDNSKETQDLCRGYIGFGQESGLVDQFFEPKEGFSYGSPQQKDPKIQVEGDGNSNRSPLNSINKWPPDLAQSKIDGLENLYIKNAFISQLLVKVLAIALSEVHGRKHLDFLKETEGGEYISLLRMFHYVREGKAAKRENLHDNSAAAAVEPMIGSSPHTGKNFTMHV